MFPFPEVLRQFGFNLPFRCLFCESKDSIVHSFIGCQVADRVWKKIEHMLGLYILAIDDVMIKLQNWWMHSSRESIMAKFTHIVALFTCWELWKAQNIAIFEGSIMTADKIFT